MSTTRICRREFQAALREHREIEQLVRSFARTDAADVRGRSGRVTSVCHDVRQLQRRLRSHFEYEERVGGLFEEILREAPGLDREVAELKREHGEFLLLLGRVSGWFGGLGESRVEEAFAELHRFVNAFLEHEAAENRLVLDLLNTDCGAPD